MTGRVDLLRGGSLRMPVTAAVATITAAFSLGATFLRGTWFLPTVVGVLAVAAGCEITRRLATSRAAVPLGGAVVLCAYLFLHYAQDTAWLAIVPTTETLDRLAAIAESGRDDINRYAAPIGVSPGVELLTVAGVGLVALAVDTLAVTWRRAALAGLPLLAVYTVPLAVAPDGVSWVAFAIGAAGFLALLLAESRERVSRWGRPMRTFTTRRGYSPQVETAPLAQVGRRVGATALGLALVVPAALPDLDGLSLGFGPGGFGSGGGGNQVSVVNPIIDLGRSLRRPDDRPVLSYRGPATYLRMVGLDEFTGDQWRPSELKVSREDNNVEDGLSRPPGLSAGVQTTNRRYSIEIYDLKNTWLPLPYPSRRVESIDGTWLYDPVTFNVFGENTSTLRLSYDVRALNVSPTPQQLRAAPKPPQSVRRFLQLPAGLPPGIRAQALDVAGGLPTAYDQALALQEWLRDPEIFTYDTEVASSVGDGNGAEAILRFLQARRGYCVHFASTMAVMARLLDIPARVAVGFTAGEQNQAAGRVVSLGDAHAWPELYFQGVGWVAFEPTPAVRTGDPPSYAQEQSGGGASGGPTGAPTPGANANPRGGSADSGDRFREDVLNQPNQFGPAGGIPAGPVRIPVLPLLIGLGVLLLLGVPAVVRLVVRRRRWSRASGGAATARAAWAELQDTLLDFGHRWRASDTPRTGVDRLVRERRLPAEAAAAALRLAGATERARYAPVMGDPGDLRSDVAAVRAGLAGTAGRWTRWRARLLPRSTRAVATATAERLADGLDALDAVAASLGQRVRGLRRAG